MTSPYTGKDRVRVLHNGSEIETPIIKIGPASRGDNGRWYRMYTVALPSGEYGYFAAADREAA